jgi:vacuolar protein sorting-associated protein 13A/C
MSLSARERLDLNISSTFVELALAALNTWSQEGSDAVLHAARGAYAPYRIRNQTGSPILVWSESDNAASHNGIDAVKILNDQIIDWRFDDWKTMREVSLSPTTIADLLRICVYPLAHLLDSA